MSNRIPAVVLGASGYVGAELLRLIAMHPNFELAAAISDSRAGSRLCDLIPPLAQPFPEQQFVAIDAALDTVRNGSSLALFSAAPHGVCGAAVARVLNAAEQVSLDVHTVDVSADFRYSAAEQFESVYGVAHPAPELLPTFDCALPEHQSAVVSRHVGHPGCFATAILLAAMPVVAAGIAPAEIYVSGITGSTGSGRSPSAGTHHPERHSNLYAYKPLGHRHTPEVVALIAKATGEQVAVNFVPHSGPFSRGIHVTLQAKLKRSMSTGDALQVYREYYSAADFIRVLDGTPRLKDVVASNFAYLNAATADRNIVITCAIDNLVKGAAGGAMQWMNRLWALPESTGLQNPAPGWT